MRRFSWLLAAFWTAVLLTAAPARAEWRRAVSTHFIVYSEASEERLREAAERLERFDGLLRRLYPVQRQETPVRLTVYMPRSAQQIAALVGPTVAGLYQPVAAGPFMIAPREDVMYFFTSDTVLFHEYAHHFMLQNHSTVYPPWFVEGFAEFLSTVRFERDGAIVLGAFARHRAYDLAPMPLRTLLFTARQDLREADRDSYYANAWFFTHYLTLSEARTGQLGRYIALVAEGRPLERAATEAFGDFDALQRDFSQYRRGRTIPSLTIRFGQAEPPAPVAIERLSPGEENLLWQQVQYRRGVPAEEIAGFARRVRARAAETPLDPAALRLLAEAEFLAGDYAASTRATDALLAIRPDDARGLLRRGLIDVEQLDKADSNETPRWRAARDWLRRANRIDPDDPLILIEYYRSFQRQGLPPSRDAAAGLARAFELVPQDFSLRMLYAEWLVDQRLYRDAALVLSPVAYSAHASPQAVAAARAIEAIRGLADGAALPAEAAAALAAEPAPDGD